MKKTFSLLAALMLIVMLLPVTAMAYEATQPTANQPAITHTLKLTKDDMDKLAYEIEYSFSVDDPTVVLPAGVVTNLSNAVTGNPSIANIKYTSDSIFSKDNRSCTKDLVIDWSKVSIKEPGVYRWTVEKTATDTDANADATNNKSITYLYAYVFDNNGSLSVSSVWLTTASELIEGADKGNLEDSYPVQTVDLSLSKTVSGNLGSREQYFKFTIKLKAPTAVNARYPINDIVKEVPATAYHGAQPNPEAVTLEQGVAEIVLWLKHGQTVTIPGLLYGTEYTIVESENTGYTVTSAITGDTTGTNADGATASDTSLEGDSKVAFTNTKEATVPTGIDLESGAPIYGMLLAMGLAVVMFIGKRKEETV